MMKMDKNMYDLSTFFYVTSHETWFFMIPKNGHMEDKSVPCKQMTC